MFTRRLSRLTRLISVSALLPMAALPAPALAAENGARVMLVLDASGSMWGKVGDITKMDAARQTIGALLQNWREQDQLGLVVYGHRQKGECRDIEVMQPMGPVDKAHIQALIGAISPKGRTPMTEAVRQAAETLKGAENKSSVILISDGIETCNADPCAVAKQLKQDDVNLVVHTVGFDIQDPTAKYQLSCIAQATGGLALTAADAGELTAAISQAVTVAQSAAPSPAPAPEPPPPPAPAAEAQPDYNLVGSARLAEGDDPLAGKEDMAWDFYKPAPEGVKPAFVSASYYPDIRAGLEPGDYLVTTRVGAASVTTPVTIKPGVMNRLNVVLGAGRLGLRAKRTETENQLGEATWQITTKGADELVFTEYKPETSVVLPAGEYRVTLTIGAAKITRDIEITPGETTAMEVVAGVGQVNGSVLFTPGGPAVKDPHIMYFPGFEAKDGEDYVGNTYGEAKIDLPAGDYHVVITVDGVRRSFPLTVRAGETLAPVWALDAGLSAFEAPGADAVIISAAEADIYGEAKELTRLYTLPAQYVLPVGSYKATAYRGDVKTEIAFEVAAGKRVLTKLSLPAP